jgi:hypothetical protein
VVRAVAASVLEVNLEVQVAPGGVAEIADFADLLSGTNDLARGNVERLHVAVPGGE